MPGQEGVNLLGGQDEGVLTRAKTGLAKEELGEHALHPKTRVGRERRWAGLRGPCEGSRDDHDTAAPEGESGQGQETPPAEGAGPAHGGHLTTEGSGGQLDNGLVSLYMRNRLNQAVPGGYLVPG